MVRLPFGPGELGAWSLRARGRGVVRLPVRRAELGLMLGVCELSWSRRFEDEPRARIRRVRVVVRTRRPHRAPAGVWSRGTRFEALQVKHSGAPSRAWTDGARDAAQVVLGVVPM